MRLLVGVYGAAVYTDGPYGLRLFVGPWTARVNLPAVGAYAFTYGNGSRWWSGWSRLDEELS